MYFLLLESKLQKKKMCKIPCFMAYFSDLKSKKMYYITKCKIHIQYKRQNNENM